VSDERPPAPGPTAPKRKKRRRSTDEVPGEGAPALGIPAEDASPAPRDGAELPAFAQAWPEDDALMALVAAFEAGNYERVRREAPQLARRTESDEVRRAARELVRRLDPDPVAVYMLAVAGLLLLFLAGWYWTHPHHP
jgi:hypothetical protein